MTANRGKYAEGEVRKWLVRTALSHVGFYRVPDLHAGAKTQAPSDFILCVNGRTVLLEVKEVAHKNRLPAKNFDDSQRARMRMWKTAGSVSVVLVYFKEVKLWAVRDVDWFGTQMTGSWLFDVGQASLAECMRELLAFAGEVDDQAS